MTENRLFALQQHGQSVWFDFISRDLLASGELARLVEAGILGVTSNPSILQKAISSGESYNHDIVMLAGQGRSIVEIYEGLALADIRAAADVLRPVYDRTGRMDGYVSLEVSPHLAHDTKGTVAEAKRLWAALDRPNIMIKVPTTPAGIPAIAELIGSGINVNVTLIFALSAYEAAANAYIDGLETWAGVGGDVGQVRSVASFFVSRVDSAVDKLLAGHPDETRLRGRAAVANAKLAYARFETLFAGQRWDELAARGAFVQRPLWASTSTKNPDYPDTMYVDALIGPHTVNTAPPNTIQDFLDHGTVARTIDQGVDADRALMADLAAAGVDMDQVTADLLDAGVKAFSDAFDLLLAGLEEKVALLTGA